MSRHKPGRRTVSLKVYIDEKLYALIGQELINLYGETMKVPYGAKSDLVESLLREWIDSRIEQRTTPNPNQEILPL